MFQYRRLNHLRASLDDSNRPLTCISTFRDPEQHLGLASLPAKREMHNRIRRHRLLCDRGRPPFAVVVFTVGNPGTDDGPASRLVAAFRRRARLSDEIGWFGRERIAMLLPVTAFAGAHQLAHEMCCLLAQHGDRPPFEVFA